MNDYVLRPLEASDDDTVANWLDNREEFANVFANTLDYPLQRDAFIYACVTGPQIARDRLCYKWCKTDSDVACGMKPQPA